MFANIHTKVRVDNLLREQNFRFEIGLSWGESSGSAGSEQWFGWFFPFNWICQHFFLHRDLDFGDVQLINVWTLVSGVCRMAFWTCCSSRRQSIQFELAMDLILRLRIGRAAHQLFFVDVTVFMREQSGKREVRKSSITTEQETTQTADPKQCKLRGWVAEQTGQNFTHNLPGARANDHDDMINIRSNRNCNFLFANRRDGSPDRHYFRVASNPVSRKFAYEFRFAIPPYWKKTVLVNVMIRIFFLRQNMMLVKQSSESAEEE